MEAVGGERKVWDKEQEEQQEQQEQKLDTTSPSNTMRKHLLVFMKEDKLSGSLLLTASVLNTISLSHEPHEI